MEKIAPTRVVRRGAHVHPLPRAAVQIDPKWMWQRRPWDVASYMAAMRTSGVIVLKDGKVVLERYGLGRRPERSLDLVLGRQVDHLDAARRGHRRRPHQEPRRAGHRLHPRAERQRLRGRHHPPAADHDLRREVERGLFRPALGRRPGRRGCWSPASIRSSATCAGCRAPIRRGPSGSTRPARPTSPACWSPTRSASRWPTTCRRRSGRPTAWSRTPSGWRTPAATSAAAAASR